MKITILMGSPNKNGSTSLLVNEFVRGAEEVGHTCEVIDVPYVLISIIIGVLFGYSFGQAFDDTYIFSMPVSAFEKKSDP